MIPPQQTRKLTSVDNKAQLKPGQKQLVCAEKFKKADYPVLKN